MLARLGAAALVGALGALAIVYALSQRRGVVDPVTMVLVGVIVSVLPDGADKEGMTCSEIVVSPDGKFVYTANRDTAGKGRDSLSVLTVGEGGKLTLLQNVPAKVNIPRNINLSPEGQWLLVAGQKSGNVPVFAVGADGTLSATDNELKVPDAMDDGAGE